MTGAATTVAVPAGRGGPDVVTFGEALVVFVAPPSVPLASATRFHRTVAGAELNVAIGLARLGHEVSFIGRVGDDPHGQLALRALRAVDPVGAGDAFAAGLLSALLTGLPIADALVRAAACGAMAVAVAGDFEGAPTLAEVGRFLEDGNAIGR